MTDPEIKLAQLTANEILRWHRNTGLETAPFCGLDHDFGQGLCPVPASSVQPSGDSRHGLLATLASYRFGRSHACLDLDLLQQNGQMALGVDQRDRPSLPTDLSQSAVSWIQGQGAITARLAQPCPGLENLWSLCPALRCNRGIKRFIRPTPLPAQKL